VLMQRASTPFHTESRAAWTRLVWPSGTCNFTGPIACWGERFAAVLCDGISVIDAVHGRHARLELDLALATSLAVEPDMLRIGMSTTERLGVPLAALAQLADTPGPVDVVARVTYPLRRANASKEVVVGWVYANGDAILHLDRRAVHVGREYGLVRGARVTLRDELW